MCSFPVTSVRPLSVEPQLVRIPQGWFGMGSETGQDNERPVHRVWVDEFRLASCAVTNAALCSLRARHGKSCQRRFVRTLHFNHPEQPVVAVSWFEAVKYCDGSASGSGLSYRLPTEAEWERAARGGVENQLYPWGDDPPQSLPDYETRWKKGPEPVGAVRAQRIWAL